MIQPLLWVNPCYEGVVNTRTHDSIPSMIRQPVIKTVEQIRRIYDSHVRNLDMAFRADKLEPFKVIPLGSTAVKRVSLQGLEYLVSRKVDARLPGEGNSTSHGARPVQLITTIRTSGLSINKYLSLQRLEHQVLGVGARARGQGFRARG